ncbi:AAA family ATPase [Pseudomonas putida]|uniref:ATP-binding protein n=1 Tax=Pseudomonas putida TaxID=303 RepID=A0A6I6XHB1_PSEPU|nr:AAA family ATPase [Pseudomonas putida]QHG64902.2 ATP-binding protein [Pseudomonas putida]
MIRGFRWAIWLTLPSLIVPAALPRRVHRAPILALAARHGVPVTAVWVQAPVEQALARNALRRVDHQVPRASIEAVAAAFEPPCRSEGFVEVIEVNASQSGHEKAARL